MLHPAEVTSQIIASRVALGNVRRAMEEGTHRAELLRIVRAEIDTLTCLLEESEESVHWKISGLILEFEGLAKSLVH